MTDRYEPPAIFPIPEACPCSPPPAYNVSWRPLNDDQTLVQCTACLKCQQLKGDKWEPIDRMEISE